MLGLQTTTQGDLTVRNSLAVAIAATLASGAAFAQTAPSGGAAGLEEVVVTAQRRAESLQKVPVAVSAFSADDIESRQLLSTVDLARTIPNLLGQNNTGTATANTYFLRGLGSTEQIALLDPAVSTYVDEVILPRQNANNYALFDVERLEVLRGPQGTTFGRNSTGGAISIITRKPGEELDGYLSVGVGSFNRQLVRGSVDLPVSERVLTKFSGYWLEDDGWLDNKTNGETLNGVENYGFRGALRLLPTDAVTWDITAEYMVSNGLNLRSDLGNRDTTHTVYTVKGATNDVVADMLNKRGLRNDTDSLGLISNLEWRISDALTMNAITGYRSVEQQFVLDFSLSRTTSNPAPGPFGLNNDGEYDMFSQEFKFNGEFGDNLRYVAGLFYFYEDNTTKAGQTFGATAASTLTLGCSPGLYGDGNMTCGTVPGYSSWRDIGNETTSFAVYAQVDWEFVDRWTAVLGARYTDESKEVDLRPTEYGGMTTEDLKDAGIDTKLDTSIVTPKVGVNFEMTEDMLFYVSATRGFKAGGWNSRTAYRPQEFQPMDPEKTWSYELGMKSQMLDDRLRLNVTGFYAETEGLQLSYTTPSPLGTGVLSTQDNAGDVEVMGAEVELTAQLTDQVSAYAMAGFQSGEYTRVNPRAQSFCTNGGTIQGGRCVPTPPSTSSSYVNAIDIDDDLSRLPEETIALGVNWDFPVTLTGGTARLTVEANYNSGYWTTASNSTPDLRLEPGGPLVTPTALNTYADSFTLLNLMLGYTSESGRWRATLECKNCSDEEYLSSIFNGEFYGEPRRLNGTVTFNF
jgi:iron complex outermembrane receptor protein